MAQLKDTGITGSLIVTEGSITGSLYGTASYAEALTNMNISQFTNDSGYSAGTSGDVTASIAGIQDSYNQVFSEDFSSFSNGSVINNDDLLGSPYNAGINVTVKIRQTDVVGKKYAVYNSISSGSPVRLVKYKNSFSGQNKFTVTALKNNNTVTAYDSSGLNLNGPNTGEDLVLQYSFDDSTWTDHTTILTGSATSGTGYTEVTTTVTLNYTSSYYVRYAQETHSGGGNDNYAITDLVVEQLAASSNTHYFLITSASTGDRYIYSDSTLNYVPSTSTLSATTFTGSFVGDGSGLNNISQGNLSLISSDTSLSTQNTVVVDSSTGDIKITLPSISSNASKEYTIKKGDSTSNLVKVSGYDSNVYVETFSVTGSEANNRNYTDFGEIYSVAINKEGTILAVSSDNAYLPGTTTAAGLVFVYKKVNDAWEEIQVISGSQAEASDYFGEQIAMSEDGNVLLVGAPLDEQTVTSPNYYNGLCYVFHRGKDTNDTFTEHGWLNRDTDASAYGRGVAISKDASTIAIGAPNTTVDSYSFSGKVYFYKRQPLSASMIEWDQEYTFTGSLAASSDRKGDVLDINRDGTVSIVGVWRGQSGNNDSGIAYIVRSGSSGWYEETVLSASTDFNDYFGNAVSINDNGDLVVVAAKQDEISPATDTGVIYIFRSGSSGWYQEAAFSGSQVGNYDRSGNQVKLNGAGDKIIVSAKDETAGGNYSAGICYYFTSGSSGWTERHYFTGSAPYAYFGSSVALSEDANTVVVGALGIDGAYTDTGKVYILERDVEKIDGKFYYNIEKEDQAVTIKNDSSSEWHVKSSYPGKNTSFNTLGTTKRTIDNIQEIVLEGGDYGQLTADYSTYLISASANSSLTLPSAADNEGMILRFYRIDDHGSTITVTLNPQAGETLRGVTSGTSVQESMQGAYGFYYLMSFGKRGWNVF